jgi:TatD DNase family protein
VIDAHCHLYSDKYNHDLEKVIQYARERLAAIVVSAVDSESLGKSLAIRRRHPDFIYVTAGIHPRKTAEIGDEERRQFWHAVGRVRSEIVAVGEVGPDFHHTRDAQRQLRQLLVLEEALAHAEQWNLPLVVHARQAEEAALEVLSRSRVPVMFHCFAGSSQIAKEIAARGFYLSFSALLLAYPELKEAVKEVPLERILTETDSPALSPRPRQTRNEPAFLETIVTHLAKLLQCSPEKAAEITESNARRFYRLPVVQEYS